MQADAAALTAAEKHDEDAVLTAVIAAARQLAAADTLLQAD